MSHLDSELTNLRDDLLEMFLLVQKQLRKSFTAVKTVDKELAREVLFNERRVNGTELKIDRDCENITALFSPKANDLRFVFSAFKMNSHLESIGDSAKGISKFVMEMEQPYKTTLMEELQLQRMWEVCNGMMDDCMQALRTDDTTSARHVFMKDEELDAINKRAVQVVAEQINNGNDDIVALLNIISISRRLERAGDLCSNIAEEIIFHVEAKVLKHENEKI